VGGGPSRSREGSHLEEVGVNRRWKIVIGTAAAAAVVGLTAGGVAAAADGSTSDGDDVALTGTELTRASEAALEETGGGQVVDSEAEENGYEVEVDLEDGRQIEVQLDADFAVVDAADNEKDGTDADDADEDDEADDD
jgi:hypothetical protein